MPIHATRMRRLLFKSHSNLLSAPVSAILYNDMVAKSIGDDTNYKQLLILPFDN